MSIVNMFNSAVSLARQAGQATFGVLKAHPLSSTLAIGTVAAAALSGKRYLDKQAADKILNDQKVKKENVETVVATALITLTRASLNAIEHALSSDKLNTNSKLLAALEHVEKDAAVPATADKKEVPATNHYDHIPAAFKGVTKEFEAARQKLIGEIKTELAKQDLPALKTAVKSAVAAQAKLYANAEGEDLGPKGAIEKIINDKVLQAIADAKSVEELSGIVIDVKKAVLTGEASGVAKELNELISGSFKGVAKDAFILAFEQNEESKKGIEAQLTAAIKCNTDKKDVAPVLAELDKILIGVPEVTGENAKPAAKATLVVFEEEQKELLKKDNTYVYFATAVLFFSGLIIANASRIPALQAVINKLPTSIRPLIA